MFGDLISVFANKLAPEGAGGSDDAHNPPGCPYRGLESHSKMMPEVNLA